jgi:two-component system chemotaxis sensor kinase CheA
MALDLAQFHESFLEESFEALDAMEAALLKLEVGVADHEGINTIFRGAHSMKGGAAMWGFDDVSSFTHTLETLLDELRGGRMQVSSSILDDLLKSVGVLRAVKGKQPINAQRVADVQFDLKAIVASKDAPPAAAPSTAPAPAPTSAGARSPAPHSSAGPPQAPSADRAASLRAAA